MTACAPFPLTKIIDDRISRLIVSNASSRIVCDVAKIFVKEVTEFHHEKHEIWSFCLHSVGKVEDIVMNQLCTHIETTLNCENLLDQKVLRHLRK